MRIDNNNISQIPNYPELPNNNNNDKDVFGTSGASDRPKTEQEWLDWLKAAYEDILSKLKEWSDPSVQPPLDLGKLKELYDKAVAKIQESFKNNTNMSPEFLRDFLNDITSEVFPYFSPENRDRFSQFMTNFRYQITDEIKKLINYQKEEIDKYKKEIEDKLQDLKKWLEGLQKEGGSPDTINALKEAISKLENQLKELEKAKSPAEFFSRSNLDGLSNALNNAKDLLSKLNKSNDDFPVDPDNDPFDTSIPRKPDGSIDFAALIKKLQDLLYYMYHGDCGNFNIYTAIAGYLTNIAGVWDQLSDTDKASFNKIMGSVPGSGGKSLGQILAESVIYGKFFGLEKDEKALRDFIDKLISKLEGKNSPFIQDFLKGIKNVRDGLGDWIKDHKDMNYRDFLREQTLKNSAVGRSKEVNQMFDAIMRAKIKELEAIAKGDPFLLFYLLLMLLFQDTDKYETQISGVGKVIEKLNELGGEAAKLGQLFQEICNRAKTDKDDEDFRKTFDLIKKFMDGAKAFCEEFKNDPRLADSFSEIEDAFKRLFSHDPEEGLSTGSKTKNKDGKEVDDNPDYKTPDGKDKTIGEVFDKISKDGSFEEKVAFAKHFQKICCPGKIDESQKGPGGQPLPPPIGEHFAQLTLDIQAFTKAPLNMNSTMTIKMEEIKATSEQFGAMITKFAKEPNDLIHRMLERIQK